MDYSTQFFCSGHILLSPTMPGTSNFFQPATRVQVREDGQASPPELGQLHLYHCCGYLKGPAHSSLLEGLAAHPAQLADHPQVARGAAAGAAWHPNGRPSKGPWAVPAAVPAWLVLAGGSCTLPWIPLPRPALLPQLFHRLTRAYASANSLSSLLRPSQRFPADLDDCLRGQNDCRTPSRLISIDQHRLHGPQLAPSGAKLFS